MHVTRFTNYALRTLAFAALQEPRLVTIEEVAKAHRIPKTHLVKCVHKLGQWGYLDCVRGRGGGFRLAKPAGEIRVSEIFRLTEDDGGILVECFDPETSTCPLTGQCLLSAAFKRAAAVFMEELDRVTVAGIIANTEMLHTLLGLHSPGAGRDRVRSPCPAPA